MASELFNKGITLRREVLGAEYVDKSMQNIDEFSMAMQEYATETAWGMIWSRPGLPRKTRSLLNIGLLAAFNRQHEFKLHVKRSFGNGVTKDEIKEVLLQIACYAGVPAGIEAFRWAKDAMAELEKEQAEGKTAEKAAAK
jgi:4-carboxymuconolactone decarboxylase